MTISEQRLERSRRLARERLVLSAKTENEIWCCTIRLHHKDGVHYRQGYIEKRKAGDLLKQYATWSYGEKDDNCDIVFSRKLPGYVKEICEDLGFRMSRRTPLTGINHRHPDYDLEQYDNTGNQDPLDLDAEQREPAPVREYDRNEQLRKLAE